MTAPVKLVFISLGPGDKNSLSVGASIGESAVVMTQGETWHIMLGVRGVLHEEVSRSGFVHRQPGVKRRDSFAERCGFSWKRAKFTCQAARRCLSQARKSTGYSGSA
jgi:hypothetical protein